MRQVLSLSLPATITKNIKSLAKKRGFASVSEYIKNLIDLDSDLISADSLLASARVAEKEYQTGRTVKAKSLADLL